MLIVLTTVPNMEEAENLAQKIIETKHAACVQILPPMTSVYYWENAMQKDSEVLMLIKTLPEKYAALETFIQENHSYEVPEIVALSTEKISESYLNWMKEALEWKM